jgi:acyl-CoA synthetase (AMP-forming)/AMP-acid ligase II
MHLAEVARRAPDRPAIVMGESREVVTFRELDQRSNRLAHALRARGLRRGDGIAILLTNELRYLEVAWAAQRSGLVYSTINWHFTADEAAYIVDNSHAKAVIASARVGEVAARLTPAVVPDATTRLMVGDTIADWEPFDEAVADHPTVPVADGCEGDFMLYSSGTTGRPKGIKRPLTFPPLGEPAASALPYLSRMDMCDGDVYLCPAPLYHSAPLAWSISAHRLGATVVVMERFEPVRALALIERERVTHSQWVPTMFIRMLKLPDHERTGFDLTTHRAAVHAAAPCPVEVKRQMIDWWGPIISEYYASTEGVGGTFITSEEWLAHPGSVGRPISGKVHIVDDDGNELPPGEPGVIWSENATQFRYHEDDAKTSESHNERGWATVNDMGYLDEEGYLYLTDRKTFMIISGGANIYPQEIENLLVTHPNVMDVAVVGVPNADMGEEVKAVVQPVDWSDADGDLEQELLAFCRAHLAHYKCPRSVDFERELPRLDNGKLYKRVLRDRYWQASSGT